MAEIVDNYSDQFQLTLGAYGANLIFGLTPAHQDPSSPKPPERIAVIRTSIEHLKVMAIVVTRIIKAMEADTGIKYKIPTKVLASLGIAPEDWDAFWSNK
jgi:hypothetical protein